MSKPTKRVKKYKTDYVMAEEPVKGPERKDKHILKYDTRTFNAQTETMEYKKETINFKNDWENTMELLEANQDLVSKKKVRI